MLQRVEEIIGFKVAATDGEVGSVKDALFDEEKWGIRHLVIDTGGWLRGNQVLVSPLAVQSIDRDNRTVAVGLTREQIENAPSISSDEPVSRQYESTYYDYYGWPPYWNGPMLWGSWGTPTLTAGAAGDTTEGATGGPPLGAAEQEMEERRLRNQNPFLHSFKEVNGYGVEASDGALGDIEDMIIDDETWKVRYMVVDTSKYFLGKDVLVPPEDVKGVQFAGSTVFMDMTKEELRNQPEFKSIDALNASESQGPVTMPHGA